MNNIRYPYYLIRVRILVRTPTSAKKAVMTRVELALNNECRNKDSEVVSIGEYNKELEAAEAAFEKGDYISHEEMIEMIKHW
jgi:hypothetical protein